MSGSTTEIKCPRCGKLLVTLKDGAEREQITGTITCSCGYVIDAIEKRAEA